MEIYIYMFWDIKIVFPPNKDLDLGSHHFLWVKHLFLSAVALIS